MKRILLPGFLGCCAFLGGAVAGLLLPRAALPVLAQPAAHVAQSTQPGQPPTTPPIPPAPGGLPAPTSDVLKLGDRFEVVAHKVSPAVVAIEATKPPIASSGKNRPVEESGSGLLIRPEGSRNVLVLTNNHVIAAAAPAHITLTLPDTP